MRAAAGSAAKVGTGKAGSRPESLQSRSTGIPPAARRESAFIARDSADDRRPMSSPELLARIEAAQAAVLSQVDLLHREFGRAESRWKHDGTRVTAIDVAI